MANGQEVVMRVGTVATFMEIILEGFLAMEASLTGTGILLALSIFLQGNFMIVLVMRQGILQQDIRKK